MSITKMGLVLSALMLTSVQADTDTKLSESAVPSSSEYRALNKEALAAKGAIKGVQLLPIDKILFVEAEQGNYLITPDGRFVFEGKLKDVWHRKTINSLEAARAIERTPLANIGFKPEEQLATFTIGNPKVKRQGAIFVDPTSPITVTALQELMKDEKNINWTVILMPLVGGDKAMDRSRRLWCSKDAEGAKIDLINGTSESLSAMKQPCSEEPIVMAMMLADLFRISHLPHLIREDGLISEGYPNDFKAWFSQK
jgi:thiol:disulfide interchange protein DsbC